jgi:NADH-quinone oxidoreductase subunit L
MRAEHHIHESPASMTVPLMILAAFDCWRLDWLAGGAGRQRSLRAFSRAGDCAACRAAAVAAAAIPEKHGARHGICVDGGVGAGALFGIWLAYVFYLQRKDMPEKHCHALQRLSIRLLLNKYYVDQIYDAMFVNRTKDLAWRWERLTAE